MLISKKGQNTMTTAEYKIFIGSKAVAIQLKISDAQYRECFDQWVDAVTGCGVEIESTKEFYDMFNTSLNDFALYGA